MIIVSLKIRNVKLFLRYIKRIAANHSKKGSTDSHFLQVSFEFEEHKTHNIYNKFPEITNHIKTHKILSCEMNAYFSQISRKASSDSAHVGVRKW